MRGRVLLGIACVLLGIFTYDAVIRLLLSGVVALQSVPGGLKMLTAALALFSLFHAWYSLGGRLTLAFFAISATISWAYEQVGVTTGLVFGAYHYTDYLGARLGDVPLLIPLAWFMMIYPSYVIAGMVVRGRPTGTPPGARALVQLAAASAVVMTAWDLVVDPILSGPYARAWVWETGGPYFGIPIHNYLGWLVTTFTVYLVYRGLEQRVRPDPAGPVSVRVTALALGAYGMMLAADLLAGVLPLAVAIIGPVVMGVPLAVATVRASLWGRASRLSERLPESIPRKPSL